MGFRGLFRRSVNQLVRHLGVEIVASHLLYDWQREPIYGSAWHDAPLPAGAEQYLRMDNAKLVELQQRYRRFDSAVSIPSLWSDEYVRPDDLLHFRGDNAWVWQLRGKNTNIVAYALTLYYLRSIDRLGLHDKLTEDEKFGNFTFTIGGRRVSRDLLDSIGEIYFLDRVGIATRPGLRVLDIGAGYGRLAHRMLAALPGIRTFLCTDAVALSTFVSDYYLRFRGLQERVRVVPLDQINEVLLQSPIDVALNIHSFSECRTEAIEWWAALLSKHQVPELMVVPNPGGGTGERLLTNDGQAFEPILERHGYRTVFKEPKFLDPVVQEYGLQPTWHHLLKLQ